MSVLFRLCPGPKKEHDLLLLHNVAELTEYIVFIVFFKVLLHENVHIPNAD